MTGGVRVRPATPADIPALAEVLAANDEPHDWPEVPGWPYLEHVVATGRVPLAEVDGRVAGFAGAIPVGTGTMVTDLFVDPAAQSAGLGGALLEAALLDDFPRVTFSSADPRALALYARAGMRPWWPNLYLEAPAGAAARLPVPPDVSWEPATVAETARLCLELSGFDRAAAFAHYAALPDSAGFVVWQAGAVVAVGWGRPGASAGRSLHHATLARDADAIQAAIGAIRATLVTGQPFSGCVPGPHPALPILLEAGFRIVDRDTFCTSDPGWLDPERILPNPGLL